MRGGCLCVAVNAYALSTNLKRQTGHAALSSSHVRMQWAWKTCKQGSAVTGCEGATGSRHTAQGPSLGVPGLLERASTAAVARGGGAPVARLPHSVSSS